jgi:HD-GYP domain-containing protein (c-di-GMP phosphodiesterase class II)/CHASE1-domain containing sensor protein
MDSFRRFVIMSQRRLSGVLRVSPLRHRYWPVVWAVCVGMAFSAAVFLLVRWWESQNIEKAFRLAANDRASTVRGTFATEVAMLEMIRSSLISDGRVERDEFRQILAPFHSHDRSIEAIEWIPRVPDGRRQDFEAAARREGLDDFQITEMNRDGRMAKARRRDEYFPVYLVGPRSGDKTIFGYDVASEPTRLESLRLARDTGKTVASGRIAFVEDLTRLDGFLVYLPVYEKGKPVHSLADRRKHLLGFILGLFRPDEMLESALAKLQPEGIDVCLYDPSAPVKGRPFHFHASRTRKSPRPLNGIAELIASEGLYRPTGLDVAGHPWKIVCLPTPEFAAARRTWGPWSVLAAGLALSAMLAARMRLSIDRREYVERSLAEKRRYALELEEKVREQTADVRRAQEEVIYRLVSASQWRDEETGMHVRRTGLLSEVLAKAAGWSAAEAEVIRQAAPMHDVGKIGIPDAILRKPDRLTPEEFEVMKTHTLIGAEMLAGSDVPMLQTAREIALNHHERWDGQGYPRGISGHDVPESARILAIVDVYDALTHDRVYRPAMPEDEVLEIMRQGAGAHFDPLLLAHFFMHLPEIRRIAEQHPDGREPEETIEWLTTPAWSPFSSAEVVAQASDPLE